MSMMQGKKSSQRMSWFGGLLLLTSYCYCLLRMRLGTKCIENYGKSFAVAFSDFFTFEIPDWTENFLWKKILFRVDVFLPFFPSQSLLGIVIKWTSLLRLDLIFQGWQRKFLLSTYLAHTYTFTYNLESYKNDPTLSPSSYHKILNNSRHKMKFLSKHWFFLFPTLRAKQRPY
jgi:hypothetical protein